MSWDLGRVGSQGAELLFLQLKATPRLPREKWGLGSEGFPAARGQVPGRGRALCTCARRPGEKSGGGGWGGHPPGDLRETAPALPTCILYLLLSART